MTLNIMPIGGLCNRLRVINAARKLALDVGAKLRIWWFVNHEMNARFTDLFKYDKSCGFTILQIGGSAMRLCHIFSRYNPFWIPHSDRDKFVQNIKSGKTSKNYLSTFSDFYPNEDYSWLRPNDALQNEIENFSARLGDNAIGLHIRRTDNVQAIAMSPDFLFEERISDELKRCPSKKFFLSTDDDKVREKLCKEFEGCVYSRMNIAARNQSNGVADAVVDLMLLAKCEKIYGSYWSSFSDVAALIGRCPLERLVKEEVKA